MRRQERKEVFHQRDLTLVQGQMYENYSPRLCVSCCPHQSELLFFGLTDGSGLGISALMSDE